MDLKEIMTDYKNKTGYSNEHIAKQLGVAKSTIGRWLSGEQKSLQEETANRLTELLGFDIDTVLKGKVVTIKKPILGYVKAGYNLFADENYLGDEVVTVEESRRGDYFLRVSGDSMVGVGIMDGDLAFIKQCSHLTNGDIGVVLVGEEVTIKKVLKREDMLILEAANPNVENRYFSSEEVNLLPVQVIGKVIYSKTEF